MPRSTHRVRRTSAPGQAGAGREFVQGLQRGFAVIKAFAADAPALTITEVADRTGLTRAVARRYLLTLRDLGYVHADDSRYALTPRVLDLGFTYLSTISVANVAEPFMEKLVDVLHESCSIAVLDGSDIVYVARVPANRIMSITLVVGSRLPAHATSMGKVLLAYLPPAELNRYFAAAKLERLTRRTICDEAALRVVIQEVRRRGWAVTDQELEEGIRSLAAPIFNHTHEVQAAINVSVHASRVSMKALRSSYLPVLLDTAQQISHALGGRMDVLQQHPAPARAGVL